MKITAFLIAAFLLLASQKAFAQSDMLAPRADAVEQLLSTPESGVAAVTQAAQAQAFYNRCLQKPDPTLPPEGQETMCACMSAQANRFKLSESELHFLATGEVMEGGEPMSRERQFNLIYGPCIGIPAGQHIYQQCYYDPNVRAMTGYQEMLEGQCACMLHELRDYLDNDAPALLGIQIVTRPAYTDPLQALIESTDFVTQTSKARSKCLATWGRKN